MVTDPIADFLTRIRNAQLAGHTIVDIPASNMKKKLTEILHENGYILKFKFEEAQIIKNKIEILEKYKISVSEYKQIVEILEDKLSFGSCGNCI